MLPFFFLWLLVQLLTSVLFLQKWRRSLIRTCMPGWGTRRTSPCLQLGLSPSLSRIEALQSLRCSLLPQPSWQRGWRHQPCQSKSLLPVIRGWGLGTSRRRRLTPGLLVSRMMLEFPWREPKTSLAQTTWRYSRGCQQMMLRGVIFISSFRYLCNFTLCLSFPSVLYIYIYIYTSFLHFFFRC